MVANRMPFAGILASTMQVFRFFFPLQRVFLDGWLRLEAIEDLHGLVLDFAMLAPFIIPLPDLNVIDELEEQLGRKFCHVCDLPQQLIELFPGLLERRFWGCILILQRRQALFQRFRLLRIFRKQLVHTAVAEPACPVVLI